MVLSASVPMVPLYSSLRILAWDRTTVGPRLSAGVGARELQSLLGITPNAAESR